MQDLRQQLGRLRRDEAGASPADYVMSVAMFVVPLYVGVQVANWILSYYHRHTAFAVLLPFP